MTQIVADEEFPDEGNRARRQRLRIPSLCSLFFRQKLEIRRGTAARHDCIEVIPWRAD
jgi:hypothetical protein